jgi:hypothetical protein
MVGWFAKRGVVKSIKNLKWILERESAVGRAKVLAVAQLQRMTMFPESNPKSRTLLNNPFDLAAPDLMSVFDGLADSVISFRMNGQRLRQNQRAIFGTDIPQFVLDHWTVFERGYLVWMSTIGAGIIPNRRSDVRAIWTYLAGSKASAREAIAHLHEVGARLGAEFGGDNPFSGWNTEEWLKHCEFVPDFCSEPRRA